MKLCARHLSAIVKLDRDLGVALDARDGVNCDFSHYHSFFRGSGDRVIH
jgi:hypothetical protein